MRIPFLPSSPAPPGHRDQVLTPDAPGGGASFWSRYISVSWVNPTLWTGYSRPLQMEDLWHMDHDRLTSTRSKILIDKFYNAFPSAYRPPHLQNKVDDASVANPEAFNLSEKGPAIPLSTPDETKEVVETVDDEQPAPAYDRQNGRRPSVQSMTTLGGDHDPSFLSFQRETEDLSRGIAHDSLTVHGLERTASCVQNQLARSSHAADPAAQSPPHPIDALGGSSFATKKLYWAFVATIKRELIVAVFGWTTYGLCQVWIALVTRALLDWIVKRYDWSKASSEQRLGDEPGIGQGIGLAFGMFAIAIVGILGDNAENQACFQAGWILRTCLWDAVSKKSFRLSPKAQLEITKGKLTTSISTDSAMVEEAVHMFANIIGDPIMMASAFGILIYLLGPSALVGIGLMLCLTPIYGIIFRGLVRTREKHLAATDRRVAIMEEALSSIRTIKLYGYEKLFQEKILKHRAAELEQLRVNAVYFSVIFGCTNVVPTASAVLTFICYTLTGNNLSIGKIFASLQIFTVLSNPIRNLPDLCYSWLNARTACHRLVRVLLAEEANYAPAVDQAAQSAIHISGTYTFETSRLNTDGDESVVAKRATGLREKVKNRLRRRGRIIKVGETVHGDDRGLGDQPFRLRNVTLDIARGQLVCVVGVVGSGKSALLQAMIGEMRPVAGGVVNGGSLAYFQQQAWVQSCSLKENIVFGDALDLALLQEAVTSCALNADISQFKDGIETEIGERGVTLSGGQRARLALARVVYSQAEIVLLDDPLAAVDSHISKYLVDSCICGALAGRTRVLVTHDLEALPRADQILVMQDGVIAERGSYRDLQAQGSIFAKLVEEYGASKSHDSSEASMGFEGKKPDNEVAVHQASDAKPEAVFGIMEDEERAEGAVAFGTYISYLRYIATWWRIAVIGLLLILAQVSLVAIGLFLGWWSDEAIKGFELKDYLAVYGSLGIAQATIVFVALPLVAFSGLRASRSLFEAALHRILRSPAQFHDRHPIGRIVSRLSKDVEVVDVYCSWQIYLLMVPMLGLCGTVGLTLYIFPFLALFFIPMFCIFSLCLAFFKRSSVELKRLDSLARSYVYSAFSEQLSGMPSIRAHRHQERFITRFQNKADLQMRVTHSMTTLQRWLACRIGLLGHVGVLATALFTVGYSKKMNPALSAVLLTYTMQAFSQLLRLVLQVVYVEQIFNNVERLHHYACLPSESSPTLPSDPPPNWPTIGQITCTDIKMRYRPELPLVLKGISLNIEGGEKIGVVGRSGAGKSSILQVLFRLVELSEGKIEIDGVDLKSVGLDTLRTQLSAIPQDPLLYAGTVRDNLDPTGLKTDAELHDVLHKCGLIAGPDAAAHEVNRLEKFKLDSPVIPGGDNFSGGERQLVALARAIVKDSKVILLDEATAAVDPETDATIQKTIRTHFTHHTILCIAHRLATVAFYDRILVLDQGQVKEFASPLELYDREDGMFRAMCVSAGLDRNAILKIRETMV